MRNDICRTNYEQLLRQFSISYSHCVFILFYPPLFFYCFCPKRIKKKNIIQKLFKIDCTITLLIYNSVYPFDTIFTDVDMNINAFFFLPLFDIGNRKSYNLWLLIVWVFFIYIIYKKIVIYLIW
jgi:hypothetical protein